MQTPHLGFHEIKDDILIPREQPSAAVEEGLDFVGPAEEEVVGASAHEPGGQHADGHFEDAAIDGLGAPAELFFEGADLGTGEGGFVFGAGVGGELKQIFEQGIVGEGFLEEDAADALSTRWISLKATAGSRWWRMP